MMYRNRLVLMTIQCPGSLHGALYVTGLQARCGQYDGVAVIEHGETCGYVIAADDIKRLARMITEQEEMDRSLEACRHRSTPETTSHD